MGQIFWKFLLAFWVALVLAGALVWGAGQASQYYSEQTGGSQHFIITPPMRVVLESMQILLQEGDFRALEVVLKRWDQEPMARDQVLLVNSKGEDYLGRVVPDNWADLLQAQSGMLPQNPTSPWFFLLQPRNESVLEWFRGIRAVAVNEPERRNGPPPPPGEMRFDEPGFRPEPGGPRHSPGGPPPFKLPFWWHPLFLVAAVALTSLGVSLALAWYFASPVRQLKLALSSLAKDRWLTQLGPKVTGRGDEFGALARSFNLMAQSVEQAISGQQRLLHDVSHELRSPLARLQLLVALGRQTPEDTPALLDKVEAETLKLDRLVGEILTFSRLDSGAMPVQPHELDLVELAESVAEDAQLEAQAKQIRLTTRLPAEQPLTSDGELLARALENLLRNALKFSPEGSEVQLRLHSDSGHVLLEVLDQGPGVGEADLLKLCQPFFRADNQQPGVGLGLSIARRAVESCGGQLELSNRLNTAGQRCGFCARIRLPA
ncbi:sensor histidine kinase [Rheinheimera sp.]|uniref:sensor histidine kinase n=1 Tax=Rheinheimera sp. TaxID=1869214 RepID=UPI003AF909C0